MDKLRDFLKSWPGKVLLVLCLAPMAFLVGGLGSGSRQNPNEVAKVGDTSLTLTELQSEMTIRRQEILDQGVDTSLINNDVLTQQVLDDLIYRTLLLQQSKKLGIGVSDETITQLLTQNSQFQDENGNFSNEIFANFLKSRNTTKNQLFAQFRQQISLAQLNTSIMGTSIYSMPAVNKLVDLQLESRDVWLHRINWQTYQDKVTVSNDEISEYYEQNKDTLKSVEMVDLSYIELSPSLISTDTVTEEDIQQQYEAYKQQMGFDDVREISQILLIGDDAKNKLADINAKLESGADFASLAKQYSDDPSAASGGAIGRFNAAVFGQEAEKVKTALTGLAVGEVSDPVITNYGIQIFKITAEDTTGIPSLDSMRAQLTEQAKAYKAQTTYADKVTIINDMAADGYGIQDIAQQEGLTVKRLTDYPKKDNKTLLAQPAVIESVFDEFTIQDQSVTTGVDVNEVTYWLQPANHRPVVALTLAQATPIIKEVLMKQKAVQLAFVEAQKIAESIHTQSDVTNQTNHFDSLGVINRQSASLSDSEKIVAFGNHFSNTTDVDSDHGIVALATKTTAGASVVVAKHVNTEQQIVLDSAQKQKTALIVRENLGQNELQDYLEFLKSEQGVEINESAFENSL